MNPRAALAALVVCGACGDDERARAHAADVASFDHVWTTVRDRHFDPTIGGVDWEAVRAELRPKVLATKNRGEARAVMREMLARLELSHFGVSGYDGDRGDGTFGMVGLDVRTIGGDMIVTDVEEDGAAAAAGVKLGWRVDAIGARPIAEILAETREEHHGSLELPAAEVEETLGALNGSTREAIPVTFEDGAGRQVVTELDREDATHRFAIVGNVGGLVVYDSRRVGADGGVGYLRIGAFLDPPTVMKRFRSDLAELRDERAVIIDLRGNPGGLGVMASGMMGELVRREVVLGTTRSRDGELRTIANPQPRPYDGLVAVLVDELSMSTSEIFAAAIQDFERGRVFGRRTPGFALPSTFETLPNGDTFQYAVAAYVTSKGRMLEGSGVVPDEIIALRREDLLAGRDTTLEAAVAWIDRQGTETEEPSP